MFPPLHQRFYFRPDIVSLAPDLQNQIASDQSQVDHLQSYIKGQILRIPARVRIEWEVD